MPELRTTLLPCLSLVALLFALAPPPLTAQPVWTGVGPAGGDTLALAIDPRDPQRVAAGTRVGGVYRSFDAGQTWQFGDRADTAWTVRSLAAHPTDSSILYAGLETLFILPSLWISRDFGATWERLDQGLPTTGQTQAILFDPASPERMVVLNSDAGPFRSDNGGSTWTAISDGLPEGDFFYDLAIDPSDGSRLYLTSSFGVYRSVDGGDTWAVVSDGLPSPSVLALAIDPATPTTVYASTSGGLARSRDGGDTWAPLGPGAPNRNVFHLEVDPHDPRALYAGSSDGLFRSTDGGDTWSQLSGLGGLGVQALAVDPSPAGRLWVGTLRGVLSSLDRGQTWLGSSRGLDNTVVWALAAVPRPGGSEVLAWNGPLFETRRSLHRSTDRGNSWVERQFENLDGDFDGMIYDPTDPRVLYAAGFEGVFKSRDGGSSWSLVGDFPALPIALAPSDPGTLYAGARGLDPEAPIFKSVDGGETWEPRGLGLGDSVIRALAVHPQNPDIVYAGGPTGGAGLFQSVDGGDSWNLLTSLRTYSLVIDPDHPEVVYAGRQNGVVARSDNGGQTWSNAFLGTGGNVSSLVMHPEDPDILYASGGSGVARSLDGGTRWAVVSDRLPFPIVSSLAIDPATPSVVYAGTFGGGVYRAIFPGADTLSLRGGRFQIRVSWTDFDGGTGRGQPVGMSNDTGYFTFFDPENVEVLIKVLDGRPLNGNFWVFFASLSNVAYEVEITDVETHQVRVYSNPAGRFASVGDIEAFPGGGSASAAPPASSVPASFPLSTATSSSVPASATAATRPGKSIFCVSGPTSLCLQQNRFQVEVTWRDFEGNAGDGQSLPLSADSGFFWFFESSNAELVVKVLDGRELNGRFWVFAGALSNVEYTIQVTDTLTGEVRTYTNPAGRFGSFGDIEAF